MITCSASDASGWRLVVSHSSIETARLVSRGARGRGGLALTRRTGGGGGFGANKAHGGGWGGGWR